MPRPLLETPPAGDAPTDYDWDHRITYLRLLDAAEENADWHEVARLVLHLDPDAAPERAEQIWRSHLARAQWMTTHGYRPYLCGTGDASRPDC